MLAASVVGLEATDFRSSSGWYGERRNSRLWLSTSIVLAREASVQRELLRLLSGNPKAIMISCDFYPTDVVHSNLPSM